MNTSDNTYIYEGNIRVQMIFDDGKHNAFTTISRWKGSLYLAFRSASSHVNPKKPEGKVKVLASHDNGESWHAVAQLHGPNHKDLRDPKLLATPTRLYVFAFEYESPDLRNAVVTWSDDGENFSKPIRAVDDPNYVIWWPIHKQGDFWAAGYRYNGNKHGIRSTMFHSKDGISWKPVTTILDVPWANESVLAMDDNGTATALVRNDGDRLKPPVSDGLPVIAQSEPPFVDWRYTKINRKLSGMAMTTIAEGLFITARDHAEGNPKTTSFLITNEALEKAQIAPQRKGVNVVGNSVLPQFMFTLPSGGDTSYAGIVVEDRNIFMSYYSSHEYMEHPSPRPAAIYLATFNLDNVIHPINENTGGAPCKK